MHAVEVADGGDDGGLRGGEGGELGVDVQRQLSVVGCWLLVEKTNTEILAAPE
jgi:hypothetical protein